MYVWSDANRTAIVCGHVPHFFGACSFESGAGERVRKLPMHLTVLDETRADWLLPISALCLLYTPGGAVEPAQVGYAIFLNSIRLPAYFFHLFTVISGVFLFI